MGNFDEAVKEWNARFADGWRSAPEHDVECPKCEQPRMVTMTTIHGTTRAYCNICAFMWDVA